MKLDVTFAENAATFAAKFEENGESVPADFGEVNTLKGEDGVSPTVDITPIDGGHRVSITDINGTQTADVMDGKDGRDGVDGNDGIDGKDGQNGKDGADGISPTVSVQDITGGHRVTISDKDGEKVFDVMDGKVETGKSDDFELIETITGTLTGGLFSVNKRAEPDGTPYEFDAFRFSLYLSNSSALPQKVLLRGVCGGVNCAADLVPPSGEPAGGAFSATYIAYKVHGAWVAYACQSGLALGNAALMYSPPNSWVITGGKVTSFIAGIIGGSGNVVCTIEGVRG